MPRIYYQIRAQPVLPENLQPETVMESKWHQPWSEPKRFPKGLAYYLQQAYTGDPIGNRAEFLRPWFQWWSEPVRFKRGLGAYLQQSFTGDTIGFLASKNIGWFNWWSEPKRFPKGLPAHLQQTDPLQVPVVPLVSSFIPWYVPLSEPVRFKPGIRAANQEFFFYEEEFPEDMDIDWHHPFSEPKRFKAGLRPDLQQFLAYHPRLLPTPDVTATLAARETGQDIALIGINVYDSSSSTSAGEGARVSIYESAPDGDDAGASIRES